MKGVASVGNWKFSPMAGYGVAAGEKGAAVGDAGRDRSPQCWVPLWVSLRSIHLGPTLQITYTQNLGKFF